ncbi:phosphatidylserine decarboxylase family protein [Bacteroidota bacterium]
MTIHKEGQKILFYLLIVLVGINLITIYFFPESTLAQNLIIFGSLILYLLVLQFFRRPDIQVPVNEKHVLAPADGKVVVIEETEEKEYYQDKRIQISIFMSPIDVHNNRAPVAGNIKYFKYHPGKYLVAWHPKSSTENERTTMVLRMKSGLDILVRQIAGIMARRIKYYVKEGDDLSQGEEFGFIKFGSRLDVFLPLDTEILIKKGSKATAGKTVLAELK